MSRRANRENSGEASLFPFLAVLLCTMGALVTLLVVMATVSRQMAERQHAEAQAAVADTVVASAEARERNDEHIAQLAELAELQSLADARVSEVDEELRRQQAKMQTVEDHLQRLHAQYLAMRDVARELDAMEGNHFDDREQAERELARLKQLADDYRQQIAIAKANADKPTSFAVVPYEGPNGTHRRPVYIECRADRVILQPEGIELKPDDFNLALGADSALASAVRAAQRYYEDETLDPKDRPYPLILVRPDGVFSYLRVRNVLEEWDAEFGYELVDADWQLDFGLADPVLAERKQLAIIQSRARAEALAQAAPGIMQKGAIDSFEPPGIRNRSNARANEPGESLLGGFGSLAGGGFQGGSPPPVGEGGSGSEKSVAELLAGTGSGNRGGNGEAANQATQTNAANLEAGLAASEAGEPGTTTSDAFASKPGGVAAGDPNAATQNKSGELTGSPVAAASPAASGSAGSNSASGGAQEGTGDATAAATAGTTPTATAASRGGSAEGSGQNEDPSNGFAIVRPVRIVATSDRVLVVPDSVRDLRFIPPSAQAKAIEVGSDPRPMMAKLRNQLQEHVTGWGMAGAGLRWKPRIELTVVPGGEQSAAYIARAARESGIEISTPGSSQKQASAQQQEATDAQTTR